MWAFGFTEEIVLRVVVTGGAGFIGANLCRDLANSGEHEVVAFDNLSTGSAENLRGVGGIRLEVGSILDPAALTKMFKGADTVVHLAAMPSVPRSIAHPVASHLTNATGTVNVLDAATAAQVGQVIVASSSSVYGADPTLPKHERLRPQPVSPYAASKLAAEAYALAWQRSFALSTVVFRFFNVYGPLQSPGHDYAAVVPAFASAALAGRPIPIHGDGSQERDFTFVGTVTSVLAAAIEGRLCYDDAINLAYGTRVSLLELVANLEELLGRPLTREHLPSRIGDVRQSQADNSVLMSLLPGVEPTSLREGLEQTLGWLSAVE